MSEKIKIRNRAYLKTNKKENEIDNNYNTKNKNKNSGITLIALIGYNCNFTNSSSE